MISMRIPSTGGMTMLDSLNLKGGLTQKMRKSYASPTLTVFGALNQLTASGSLQAPSESVGDVSMVCSSANMFNANCM